MGLRSVLIFGSTLIMAVASAVLLLFVTIVPAWTTQSFDYASGSGHQGFGLFTFTSHPPTTTISWVLNLNGTVTYGDFCNEEITDPKVRSAVCGSTITILQIVMVVGAAFAALSVVSAVIIVFRPTPGYAERSVNWFTLLAAICTMVILLVWSLVVQTNLLNSELLNPEYSNCSRTSVPGWSCWFYGYAYWVALAATISLAITGCLSSRCAREKYRKANFREQDAIMAAVMASSREEQMRGGFYNNAGTPAGQLPHAPPVAGGPMRGSGQYYQPQEPPRMNQNIV